MSCACGLSVGGFLTTMLLVNLSLRGKLSAHVAKHCQNFNEEQLTDMGRTIPCHYGPGLGPYAECNVTDLQKDLVEVKPVVRTLCIYHNGLAIRSGSFSRFPELRHLHIWGIPVRKVEAGAFAGLPNLASLFLLFHDTKCREVTLGSEAFQGLGHLEELDLRGLKLPGIANDTFKHLLGLEVLKLKCTCSADLGDVFCLLPTGMSRLRNLTMQESDITAIKNQGCANGSQKWPTDVLSKVNVLSIEGRPIATIEPNSLQVFQNLSSLTLDIKEKSISTIWESGIGQVAQLELSGNIMEHLQINFKSLCQVVHNLTVSSLILNYIHTERLSEADTGQCGKELKTFEIWNAKIHQFDSKFWTNPTNLVALRMRHVHLNESNFCLDVHETFSSLVSLDLRDNRLSVIGKKQFSCMPKLEVLDLSLNLIATLKNYAFWGLSRLRILKLTHNKIHKLSTDDFRQLPALEVLNIDQNLIETIEDGVFRKQKELQELRLGKIDIIYRLRINMIFYGIPPKLRYLSIDAGPGTNLEMNKNIQAPNGTFILHLQADFLETNLCDNALFKAVRELKVNSTQFTCRSIFMVEYFPNLESFEFETRIDKLTTRYTRINTLTHLKRLKLTNLNFAEKTDPMTIFHNLTKLQVLVLSNCQFTFLTREMFQDLTALQVLRLYSTSPLLLLDGVFDALSSLTAVVFDRVDFRCDCENGWLLAWAERSIRVQVIYLQRQKCVWHYNKLAFLSTMERLCQTDVEYLCYMWTALAILFLTATSLGYNFGRWPFLVVFFRLRGWLERRIGRKRRGGRKGRRGEGMYENLVEEEEEGEEAQYDAFVSFSSRDEAWVLRELAPRLEEKGEPKLRLCLHNRDFEVGKGIVDNIAESIYNSRRTVCVLSRHYLRSDWCSLELRVATHRLLAEQKHRLILIFLEHISPFELSAFHRLAKLVKSRTYLDWPEDEAERVKFWERLRRAIAEGE